MHRSSNFNFCSLLLLLHVAASYSLNAQVQLGIELAPEYSMRRHQYIIGPEDRYAYDQMKPVLGWRASAFVSGPIQRGSSWRVGLTMAHGKVKSEQPFQYTQPMQTWTNWSDRSYMLNLGLQFGASPRPRFPTLSIDHQMGLSIDNRLNTKRLVEVYPAPRYTFSERRERTVPIMGWTVASGMGMRTGPGLMRTEVYWQFVSEWLLAWRTAWGLRISYTLPTFGFKPEGH